MKRTNFLLMFLVFLGCSQTPLGTGKQCNLLLSNFSAKISSFHVGLTTYNQMFLVIGRPTLIIHRDFFNTNYKYQIFDPYGDYCGEYMFYFVEGSCVTSTAPNNVTVDDCTGILQSFSLI